MAQLPLADFVVRCEEAYQSGAEVPWDLDGPTPFVARLAADGQFRGTVLDSGCGTGENAIHLAGLGYRVIGVDAAPTALARARAKAAARGVTVEFAATDVRTLPGMRARFDTVLDSGLFHGLAEADQLRYAEALWSACRDDAVVHLFAMSDNPRNFEGERRWKPSCARLGVSVAAITNAFGSGWTLERLDEAEMEVLIPHQGKRPQLFWLARLRRVGTSATDE